MSFMDPPAQLPPSTTLALITAASATTTSSITNVDQYEALLLQVSGTWRGAVIVEGRIDGADWTALPVTNAMGLPLAQITGIGIFYVNLAGMTTFRVRALPASGSVTVTGKKLAADAPRVAQRRVNNRVAQAYQVSVGAGANANVFSDVDVSGYVMIAAAFRCPDSEITASGVNMPVQIRYAPTFNRDLGGSSANGMPESFITLLDTVAGRGQCDWIFNRSELATINIKNNHSSDHLFDVWLLGMH